MYSTQNQSEEKPRRSHHTRDVINKKHFSRRAGSVAGFFFHRWYVSQVKDTRRRNPSIQAHSVYSAHNIPIYTVGAIAGRWSAHLVRSSPPIALVEQAVMRSITRGPLHVYEIGKIDEWTWGFFIRYTYFAYTRCAWCLANLKCGGGDSGLMKCRLYKE